MTVTYRQADSWTTERKPGEQGALSPRLLEMREVTIRDRQQVRDLLSPRGL